MPDFMAEYEAIKTEKENLVSQMAAVEERLRITEAAKTELESKLGELREDAAMSARTTQQLIDEAVDILNEYDRIRPKLEPLLQELASNIIDRLQNMLERAGLALIDGETVFDSIRHVPQPLRSVPEGCTIIRTIEPGLANGRRVCRRAKVEVDVPKH